MPTLPSMYGKHARSHRTRQTTLQVIDDTDPSIAYIGAWRALQWSAAFNSTMHSSNAAGAAIEYHFNGPMISVSGPVGVAADFRTPVSTYAIDDTPPVVFTAPVNDGTIPLNNVQFFSATNLSSGPHTLIIRRASTDDATYFFDFIQVQPSADSSDPPASVSLANAHKGSESTTSATTSAPTTSATTTSSAVQANADDSGPTSQSTAIKATSSSADMTWSSWSSSRTEALISFPTAPSGSTNTAAITSPLLASTPLNASSSLDGTAAVTVPASTVVPAVADAVARKEHNVKGIIAGAVVGAVFVIALVVAYAIRRHRRMQTRTVSTFQPNGVDSDGHGGYVTPRLTTPVMKRPTVGYSAVPPYTGHLARSDTASIYSTQTESMLAHDTDEQLTYAYGAQVSRVTSGRAALTRGLSVDHSEVAETEFLSPSLLRAPTTHSAPMRDTDGGIRLAGGPIGAASDEPDLLPPAYSSSFGLHRF